MNRTLLLLVAVEAAVIVLLLGLYVGRGTETQVVYRTQSSATTTGVEAPVDSGRPVDETQLPAELEPVTESEEEPAVAYAIVHGSVTDGSGAPVTAGAWLSLTGAGGEVRRGSLQDDGHFALANLAPGPYQFAINSRDYGKWEQTVELAPGANRVDAVVQRSIALHVRIETEDGKPIAQALAENKIHFFGGGVIAVATREPPQRLPMTELRGHSRFGAGEFRGGFELRGKKLPAGVAGVLTLKGELPVYVSAVFMHEVLETVSVDTVVEELKFVIPVERVMDLLGTAKLRVLDAETGLPCKGRVTLSDRQSSGGGQAIGDDGWVEIKNIPPGLKEFQIWAGDHEMVHDYVRIPGGGVHDLGTFRLTKPVTIAGSVVDPDGKPVAARLVVRNLDRMTFPQPLRHAMTHSADAEGAFNVGGAGRGRYLIVASQKGWATAATVVDTSSGALEGVQIRMRKGTDVTLTPTMESGPQFLGVLKDANETILYSANVRGTWPIKLTLVPGTYTLEIHHDDGLRGKVEFEVKDEALTKELPY